MTDKELLKRFCPYIAFKGPVGWTSQTVLASVALEECWDGEEETTEGGVYAPDKDEIDALIQRFLADKGLTPD